MASEAEINQLPSGLGQPDIRCPRNGTANPEVSNISGSGSIYLRRLYGLYEPTGEASGPFGASVPVRDTFVGLLILLKQNSLSSGLCSVGYKLLLSAEMALHVFYGILHLLYIILWMKFASSSNIKGKNNLCYCDNNGVNI